MASRSIGMFLLTGATDEAAFQKSIATSVAAKAVGFVNQVVGLSLVAAALGASGLASVLLSFSLFSIFNLVPSATIVALPPRLIAVRTRPQEGRRLIAGALVLHLAGAGLSVFVGVLATAALASVLHVGFLTPDEVLTAAVMGAIYLATWLAEHVLTAYRKIFIFNLSSLIGSVVSLAATFLAFALHMHAWAFVAAYYLSIVVPTTSMFACVLLSELRPSLDDLRNSIPVARELLKEGAPGTAFYVWVTTKSHVALSALALVTTAGEVAVYGTCMRVCLMVISGLSLFFNPLLAEAAHAVNDGKIDRFASLKGRVFVAGLIFGVTLVVLMGAFGPALLARWLAHAIVIARSTALLAGAAIAAWAMESLLFYVTSAVRRRDGLGRMFLVTSVLVLAMGLPLAYRFGANGVLAAIIPLSVFAIYRLAQSDISGAMLPESLPGEAL